MIGLESVDLKRETSSSRKSSSKEEKQKQKVNIKISQFLFENFA